MRADRGRDESVEEFAQAESVSTYLCSSVVLSGFFIHGAIMADETKQDPATPPTPPPAPPAAAAPPGKPADKSKKPFDKRKPRGDGPKRRIPSLDSDMDYKQKTAPNVRDLDAEIADEL